MAAIDPSAPIDPEASGGSTVARATLKLIREPIGPMDDEDDSEGDDDDEYMRALLSGPDSEEDDSEEDEKAGPSDPAKSKKARKQAALEELLASIDKDDSDEDMEDEPKKVKGKAKAAAEEDDEEDSDEDDEEDMEIEEFVICTLDAEKVSFKEDSSTPHVANFTPRTSSNLSTSPLERMSAFSSRSPEPTPSTLPETTSSLMMTDTTTTTVSTTPMRRMMRTMRITTCLPMRMSCLTMMRRVTN